MKYYEQEKLNQIAFFIPPAKRYRLDPRFLELMHKLGLAGYWRGVETPDFCDLDDGELICR